MRASIAFIFGLIVLAGAMLIPSGPLFTASERESVFHYTGDGRIAIIDMQTGYKLSIAYRDSEGRYDDSALAAIDHTLRCHGDGNEFPISLKLVELIDHIQDHYGADEVQEVSGYRSPDYNAALKRKIKRVAHDSLHMQGMAMDILIPGVGKAKLGAFARSLAAGGVGVYRSSRFVHIDVGEVRSW